MKHRLYNPQSQIDKLGNLLDGISKLISNKTCSGIVFQTVKGGQRNLQVFSEALNN